MTALVVLEKTTFSFDRPFSYNIPSSLSEKVFSGSRVLVPFGSSNRQRMGVVLEINAENSENLKDIKASLDSGAVFTPEQLILARELKESLFCTYFDVLKAMLPTGLNLKPVKEYSYVADSEDLSEEEKKVASYLKKRKKVRFSTILSNFPDIDVSSVISSLIEKGAARETETLKRMVGDLKTKYVSALEFEGKLTPKQSAVMDFLRENGELPLKELLYFCAVGKSVVENLVKVGAVKLFEKENFRDPYENVEIPEEKSITLSEEQRKVYLSLEEKLFSGVYSKTLLYGVTGSGKTAVYLELIKKTVESGKNAIMLVPEISLTPAAVKKFKAVFGSSVAVLHSGLSLSERLDEWKRIKEKKASIVVGTRSAILSPLENIGVIVIDEAHETSYVSDNNPRYSAVSVAELRARYNGCPLLLSSATPLIEQYYEAEKTSSLLKLKNRYNNASLPEVFVIDLKGERERRGKIISSPLAEEICYNLENGEQTILLLNRRGYNTALTCMQCGESVKCPSCSAPMTYHKANESLVCHYCGRMTPPPEKCPECQSEYIHYEGAGTQSLEAELKELFPKAKVLRMDLDTTQRSMAHEEYLSAFGKGEYDILIGTQMIAKGLDFEKVTLVGVLSADSLLSSSDWSANSKAFSLLTQVVGRSGRGGKKGRAYIQSFAGDNPIITVARRQDYEAFYSAELRNRKIMLYPPFCSLWSVQFSSENAGLCLEAAKFFLKTASEKAKETPDMPLQILGPVPPPVEKVAGKYRQKLTVKCRKGKQMQKYFSEVLKEYYNNKNFSEVSVSINTNRD